MSVYIYANIYTYICMYPTHPPSYTHTQAGSDRNGDVLFRLCPSGRSKFSKVSALWISLLIREYGTQVWELRAVPSRGSKAHDRCGSDIKETWSFGYDSYVSRDYGQGRKGTI